QLSASSGTYSPSIQTDHCSSPNFSFFFTSPSTTETYTLSLHDALPICARACAERLYGGSGQQPDRRVYDVGNGSQLARGRAAVRSEEHTSELQSRGHLVCRLLLEKKNTAESSAG